MADGAEDLRLIFTCIDPQDTAREFMFAVHVTPDTHYVGKRVPPSSSTLHGIDHRQKRLQVHLHFLTLLRKTWRGR